MNQKQEKEQILTKINDIIENLFKEKVQEINDNTNLVDELRMTSIDILEFLLSIENEFGFEFEDDDLHENTLKQYSCLYDRIIKYIY